MSSPLSAVNLSLSLVRRLFRCGFGLLFVAPLIQAAEVELISGFNFGQFIAAGEASTDGLNGTPVGFIRSNYAGDTVPGVEDSGYYKVNNAIETSYSAGVATLYWNGTRGSDAWTISSGVSVYEHGALQAINHNLVTGDIMIYGDDTNFGLRFASGANNEFALVVNTEGWSDFAPSAFDQPNDYNFTFSAFAHSGASATVEWFLDGVSIGSFTASPGDHQAFNLDLPSSFYGDPAATLVGRVTGDLVLDNIQINGVAAEPPTFTDQPDGQTVTAGADVTFTVAVTGAPSPTYRWKKDGVALSNGSGVAGATTATLTLTGVDPADAGSYSVVVGNNGVTAESSTAALVVQTVPVIDSQPFDVVANPGESAVFTVSASGIPAPSYQWRKDGVDLADGPGVSGSTTATLTLANLVLGDAGDYTVVVTNAVTSVESAPATLTVTVTAVAPVIQQQPEPATVVAGQTATFAVIASGAPAPSYRWRKDGVDLSDGGGITGATTATLQIASTVAASGGAYSVVVTNTAGEVESVPVSLTIHLPPVVTQAPVPLTVRVGQPAAFTVTATGTPAPAYQWLKDGEVIPGATLSTYAIARVSLDDAARYSVVVTNVAASVTSAEAVLAVIASPAITRQPVARTVPLGDPASFTVKVTGTPAPVYQWFKDGVLIPGATKATYTLSAVKATDAGAYRVVVKNSGGSVTSASAKLLVSVPVDVDATRVQSFVPGTRLSLTANFPAASVSALRFQWYLNNKAISGARSATYLIEKAKSAHSGTYSLKIYNASGRLLITQTIAKVAVTVAATYDALLRDPVSDEPVGRLEVKVEADGRCSGRLLFEDGGDYAFKGDFDLGSYEAAGSDVVVIKRATGKSSLELDLVYDAAKRTLGAGLSVKGDPDLLGLADASLRTASAKAKGSYTLSLKPIGRVPSGQPKKTFTATATIGADGVMRLQGKTGDGAAFDEKIPAGADLTYAVFIQPYGKARGHIAGRLKLVKQGSVYTATLASGGEFHWFRPANTGPYRKGIDLTLSPALKRR